jgi:hypothetical protein
MLLASSRARLLAARVLVLASLSACGRSVRTETEPPADGSGGADGNAAPPSDAGAAGASKADACVAYTLVECTRRAECTGGDVGDCWSATEDCPDALFSAGSTRTVAGTLACARAYATFSCDDLRHARVPSCATPGTLEAGATCEFSAQCASLTCVGSPCGTCAASVAVGQPCVSEGVVCATGSYCGGDGRCALLAEPSARPGLGDRCASNVDCPDQAFCSTAPPATTGTCVPFPDVGQPCAGALTCRTGYCDADETCHELPGDGAACGVDASTGRATFCASGLTCSPGAALADGTCIAPRGEGEPCVTAIGAVLATSCASGLYCDTSAQPATCSAPKGGGEPCSTDAGALACVQGYECACKDDCAAFWCVHLGLTGDACDDSFHGCHPAFECSDGVCVPRDSQGYADRCAN